MSDTTADTGPPISDAALPFDPKALQAFLTELAIFSRHCRAYTADHPVAAASAAKVVALLQGLLRESDAVTVGVGRDSLVVAGVPVDRRNLLLQNFAGLLHDRGVAAVTFTGGLLTRDLFTFATLLGETRSRIWELGGPHEALARAEVTTITVEGVSSDLFRLEEVDPLAGPDGEDEPLWDAFIRALAAVGLLPGGDREGLPPAALLHLLAALQAAGATAEEKLLEGEELFLAELPPLSVYSARTLEKIAAFAERLGPRLRKLFVRKLLLSPPRRADFAEALLGHLQDDTILDALEDVATGGGYVPPLVLKLMAKLGMQAPAAAESVERPAEEVGERLRVLLRKDQVEKFVPPEYRQALAAILEEGVSPSQAEEIAALKRSLEDHNVEGATAAIIFEIMAAGQDPDQAEGLAKTLRELATYFLHTGDFDSLLSVLHRARASAAVPEAAQVTRETLSFFGSPAFVTEVLDGLVLWGKEKREVVTRVIDTIGPAFIPQLLERLAEEQNLSLRRCYMDRLAAMGDAARDAAVERLRDSRWYFVRNLVVLLRRMNDPEALRQVRSLATHPHPRVREEVLRTFLEHGDAAGEKFLLQELGSGDRDRVLNAVRLAESSRNPQVMRDLLAIVAVSSFADYDLQLKTAAVQSLARMGRPEALPELERQLGSLNLFHPILHGKLKAEIVRALGRYPAAVAVPLLEKVASQRSGELPSLAAEVLRQVRERKP